MRSYDCYNLETLSEAIEEMANRGCEVIFVDWIGMIEAPGNSQPERVRNIMARLKQLAITKNVAIIAMQQLNRQMDGEGRMPRMYDIAD
jgi:replicative DNA helicase